MHNDSYRNKAGESCITFLCHSLRKASVSLNRFSSSGRHAFICHYLFLRWKWGGGWVGKEAVLSKYVLSKKDLRLDSHFLSVSSFSKHSPAATC